MTLNKQKIFSFLVIIYTGYIFFISPKFFYGDSLFFLELFQENNWNPFRILIEWYGLYGFYRCLGIVLLFFFYFVSFGNIYVLLLLQILLYLFIIKQFSKYLSKDPNIYLKSVFIISCIPLSNIILLQPISFHQLVATSILILSLKNFYKNRIY